jgi:hypothetical protein
MAEATMFEDPDKAQQVADSLHYASCDFSVDKARNTLSKFVVRDAATGKAYEPPPLIENQFVFVREKRSME